jgi:hypothetical protein
LSEDKGRTFSDWLLEQGGGETHQVLTDGLTELVAAVQEHGSKGTLTLTITIEPMGSGDALVVADKVVVKPPIPARAGVFYPARGGGLTGESPTQPGLFEDAETGHQEVRMTVVPATGTRD